MIREHLAWGAHGDHSSAVEPPRTRGGRAPATRPGELSHIAITLFAERGFERTTVEEIAQAAGIGRRTFFRYFASKNDLPWGEFEPLLADMQAHLAAAPANQPIIEALRLAVLHFNRFPAEAQAYHRKRMSLLLNVPSLMAHSTLKYAAWCTVIAEFVARRRGEHPNDLTPQTIAWARLGLCLGSYERWLGDDSADLLELLDTSFATAESIFGIAPARPESSA